MRIILIAIFALSLGACSQKKNITTSTTSTSEVKQTVEEPIEDIKETVTEVFDNDCFRGRSVTKEINEQEASMTKVMNMYMFTFENTRWQACSVPVEYHMEGLKVKVSGQVLEIKPNERRAGTPFNISSLEKM